MTEISSAPQKRRAAVVVGRFNPPTIGHYAVFDKVKEFIRKNGDLRLDAIPIVVIVDGKKTGADKNKNPLTPQERISFMEASGKADGVKFLVAGSAFDAFHAVRKAGFEPIAIAAGSDRADNYLELLDKYFKDDRDRVIDHYVVKLDRDADSSEIDSEKDQSLDDILQYMDQDIPVDMVSGSLARHAVKKDSLDKFAIITGLTPKLAALMFKKIKSAMDTMEKQDGAA